MRLISATQAFPLLARELVERASRRRTYLVRLTYALLSVIGCAVFLKTRYLPGGFGGGSWGRYTRYALGQGMELFEIVLKIQFAGIAFFLPALMSGLLSQEKENGTLPILFLTDLRPSEILFQKFIGGMIPMMTILLLAMPIAGFSYTLGGVSPGDIGISAYCLFVFCFQLGALSLLLSALSWGTLSAFLGTYAIGVPLFFAPLLLVPAGDILGIYALEEAGLALTVFTFPLALFLEARINAWTLPEVLVRSIPGILMGGSLLILGRLALTRQGFRSPGNLALKAWKPIDEFLLWLNEEYARGVILVRDRTVYPDTEPVAWRERYRRSLGRFRYVFRVVAALEIPTLLVSVLLLADDPFGGYQRPEFSVVVVVLWSLAALWVAAVSVNAIASERSRNTLDVLLATPIPGESLIRQKLDGTRRVIGMFSVPMLSTMILQTIGEGGSVWGLDGWTGGGVYLLLSALSIAVYLPAFSWLAIWIGLKARTRLKGLLYALGFVSLWNVVPAILMGVALSYRYSTLKVPLDVLLTITQAICPALCVLTLEYGEHPVGLPHGVSAILVMLNLMVMYYLFWHFRKRCLEHADQLLGRVPEATRSETREDL